MRTPESGYFELDSHVLSKLEGYTRSEESAWPAWTRVSFQAS